MALVFPLSRAAFWDWMPLASMQLHRPEQMEMSQRGNGELIRADMGARLWRGSATLGRLTAREAADAETLIDVLRGGSSSFLVYDRRRPYPASDPTGALLGSATPSIHTVVSARELRLTGLPVGYQLRRGDRLSFLYSGSHALHRVVDATVTAAGTGITPAFEVVPPLRSGATAGLAVSLVRPACKAVIVPGSIDPGQTRATITEGIAFEFQQTLR